ncbi:MAG: hypothetical protein Q4C90_09310 [Kocuria sp.]|uniref:hypothetical protein n=1 Tax=Kocuria TaxID=57493 RepID=UPI0011A2D6C0|nr:MULTISPECIES: hypothetical protein [Kocuria]MBS6030267.1 hypothetical protein [Kocuria rhizophila]MDO4257339.1 hypothetical protein [Kocuria sp.]
MKRLSYLVIAPVMMLCLAGCNAANSSNASPTTAEVSPGASTAEADATSPTSERGNLQKKFGESAGITVEGQNGESEPVIEFTVKSVDMDTQCTSPVAMPAENGHLVTVNVEAETGPAESFKEALYGQDFMFNPADWKFVDDKGKTANSVMTNPVFNCLDSKELIREMGPAERANGKIVLDLPSTKGTLIYGPSLLDGAWEWNI